MSDLASLLSGARQRLVRYKKGQIIFDEGEPSSAVFRVVSGCVRLQINGADGHRQIVGFLFPGDLFGLCVDERTSSAGAIGDVELTRYALDSVLQLSTQSTELTFELIRTINTQFNALAHQVEHVTHLPARERVLWFLSGLADRRSGIGASVPLPMNRRDIGDFLALAPETLSRVIKTLQEQGIVAFRGPRAFTVRIPALKSLPQPFEQRPAAA